MSGSLTGSPSISFSLPHRGGLSLRKKVLFSSLTLTGLLVGAEAAVRVRDLVRFGSSAPGGQIYVAHPVLGKVPKAGAVLEGQETSIRINSLGFRGAEIAQHKPAGTFRIACLGGSTTFGLYCGDNDHTWPALLEQRLRMAYPGRDIEVINAGVPGYTLTNSLTNFQERVQPLKPDLVIIYHGPNDLSFEQQRAFGSDRDDAEADGVWPVTQWLTEQSLLFRKVVKNIHVHWASTQGPARHDRLPNDSVRRIGDRLGKLVVACQADGAQVVVCTVATQFRADQPDAMRRRAAGTAMYYNKHLSLGGLIDAYDRINVAVRALGRDRSLVLADLAGAVPGDGAHFGDSVHFTDEGTAKVADCLAEAIVQSGLVSTR